MFEQLALVDHPNIVKLHKYWLDASEARARVSHGHDDTTGTPRGGAWPRGGCGGSNPAAAGGAHPPRRSSSSQSTCHQAASSNSSKRPRKTTRP